jgi:hypothetical protein
VQKSGQVFRRCPPEHYTLTLDVKAGDSNVSIFLSEVSAGSEADVPRCGAKLLLRCDEQNVLHRGAENGSVVDNGDLSERKTAV